MEEPWTDYAFSVKFEDLGGLDKYHYHEVSACGFAYDIRLVYVEDLGFGTERGWYFELVSVHELEDTGPAFSLHVTGNNNFSKIHAKTLPGAPPKCCSVGIGLNDATLSDCIIQDDQGKKLHASKLILAASSDYFRISFQGRFQESVESVVKVQEVDGNMLHKCIAWIYTGEISLDPKTEPVTAKLVLKLFEVADRLLIPSLAYCLRSQLQSWSVCEPNFLDLYQFATRHDESYVKNRVWDFWCSRARTVGGTRSAAFLKGLTTDDEVLQFVEGVIAHKKQ
ncbi:Kelch-like protein 40 [Geranomyces variabilis]|nr:Kelch-like protein 40 [Geranomyces variabilis]